MSLETTHTEQAARPRQLISRTTMLILAGFLVGLTWTGAVQAGFRSIVFMAGMAGLVAFLGLNYVAHLSRRRNERRARNQLVSQLEQRLDQHVIADDEEPAD